MDWDDLFPVFAIAAVASFVLSLKSFFDVRALRAQLAGLTDKLPMYDHRLLRLAERIDGLATAPRPAEPAPLTVEEAPATPAPEAVREQPVEAAPVVASPTEEVPPTPAAAPPQWDWERLLVENWLVWLGGAALALGGGFLVKLSIDYGLLTPAVRVLLSVLLGIGLAVGGEWVWRREVAHGGDPEAPSYVPQALAAAGAATVFASLYAAHQLYGLLPSSLAFPLLALTAGATVAQSLRMGPYVAALGLVGAFVVPLLVESDEPHALPLFAYLAVVTAGSLAVLRHRAWWWLAWLSLAGAMLWVALWLGNAADPETPVVALYLLGQIGLFTAFRRGVPRVGFLAGIADTLMVRVVTRAAMWAVATGLFFLANADGFGATSVAAAFVAAIGFLALAYRDDGVDDVIAPASALAAMLLASWNLPHVIPEMNLWVFRLQPDHIADFMTAAGLFVALLGGGPFLLLPRVARPGRWAALSAAAPLLVLVIAYWRLQKFDVDIAWTLTALVLAAIELGAASWVAQRRNEPPETPRDREIEIALAAYAVGVLGSTIAAATLALGEAWLTVALALHLPALGWIDGRFRLPVLRWLALGVAGVVLVRLVLNPDVLSYELGPTPIFNWLLYGYGVPAASFIVATRQFGSRKDDALIAVLEAGSSLFLLLLLSFELTHAIYGRLTLAPADDFASGSALTALWFVYAAALLALGEYKQRPVLRWGGLILLTAVTPVLVGWQFLSLIFGARVGKLPVLDALFLADAVPALVFAAIAWRAGAYPVWRWIARLLAAAFAFWWMTLEVQHWFHARVELYQSSTDAEWYTYSVVCLVFAATLTGTGLWRGSEWLRRAGLLGIALVIAKVFLSDMAELEGVLRALSFLGLGAALVGLGYAYRRLRPAPGSPSPNIAA